MDRERSCEERIFKEMSSRLADLRRLWRVETGEADMPEADETRDELGEFHEYGLSFGYVSANPSADQDVGYFRYQLSWSGPLCSDEFRFYVDPDLRLDRVEYWFLDWFDGASRTLEGEDRALLAEIWEWFCDAGAAEHTLDKAQDR